MAKTQETTLVVQYSGLNKILICCILAAVIAWIVYVAKARSNDVLGDNTYDVTSPTADQTIGEANIATADICFQAVIAVAAIYFVLNHHLGHY
jgi:hypothetical protein